MEQKNKIRRFLPLMLSAIGIVLWVITRIAGGGFVNYITVFVFDATLMLPFVDYIDLLMFGVALILPIVTLILLKKPRPIKVCSRIAIASLAFAAAQVAFAVIYYFIFVKVGGGRAPEIVPGATLLLSIVGMIHGYLINLLYALAGALFIASSAVCYFVLRIPKAPEATLDN